jgi:hypothetical protein
MTIVHRPLRAPVEPEEKGDDPEQLTRLLALCASCPRTPTRSTGTCNGLWDNLAPWQEGTLGGILKDSVNGKFYGVTCDHGVRLGKTVEDRSGASTAIDASNESDIDPRRILRHSRVTNSIPADYSMALKPAATRV